MELIILAHVTSLQAAAVTRKLCRCFRLFRLLSRTISERRRTSGPATTRKPRFACSCRARAKPHYVIVMTNRVKAHVPITTRNLSISDSPSSSPRAQPLSSAAPSHAVRCARHLHTRHLSYDIHLHTSATTDVLIQCCLRQRCAPISRFCEHTADLICKQQGALCQGHLLVTSRATVPHTICL